MAVPTLTSLTERVTSIQAGGHVVTAAWLGRTPVFAIADGEILFAGLGEERRVRLFPKAGLQACTAGTLGLLAGGDDGQVVSLAPGGSVTELAPASGQWVDAVALASSGAAAWSSGRSVSARDDRGTVRTFDAPSTVRGLAFAPKGYRVAAAHYNGVSFWFPNTAAAPDLYEWKGSHIDVTVSPDGRFIVTSLQENQLHGWTAADKKHMRMSGYPSKTRSLSWSADGHWLASSGADAAIVWPFQAKDGPMGKAPRECGVRAARVVQVAFHPKALVLAVGYSDGCILLCRLNDSAELLVRAPETGSAVTALAWDATGAQLAFGAEDGAAGVLTLPG